MATTNRVRRAQTAVSFMTEEETHEFFSWLMGQVCDEQVIVAAILKNFDSGGVDEIVAELEET